MVAVLAMLLGCAAAGGCSSPEDCPSIAADSLFGVTVTDASTGEPICNAEVRVQVAEIDAVVEPLPRDPACTYPVRQGKLNAEHTVTVTAPGYEPFTTKVFVAEVNCGLPAGANGRSAART